MAIDPDKVLAYRIPDKHQDYAVKDTILYALGLGLGADPMDKDQLKYVYEDGLKALPTMAVVLGYHGFWIKDAGLGIDWKKILHGEQAIEIHKPIPPAGKVIGKLKVTALIDKGPKTGALMYSTREVFDQASGDKIATLTQTTVARGDGGFGGASGPVPEPHQVPERAPDLAVDLKTLPQAALIYRLSGDYNPLHADPEVAKVGGFKQPILHGLCTYGVVGHALLKGIAGYDAARFKRMQGRFTSPVYPGETIRTEIWREGGGKASFRASVVERGVVVINNGLAVIA